MKRFFTDPKNLRYRLNIIMPVVVFLTSILSAVVTLHSSADPGSLYSWIIGVSLFSAFCSFLVIIATTQPLEELLNRAEQLVRFDGKKSERGQMIEVYQLIERLMESIRSKKSVEYNEKTDIIEEIERLDYLLPLGYMSLMVAHEVRNPLSVITGMSELLREKMEGGQGRVYVDQILDAAKKIDVFTKELLDFTDDEVFKGEVDINVLVDDVLEMTGREFGDVRFRFKKGDGTPFHGDRNKLSQSLYNILRNAFEYENKGGYVEIETVFGDWITVSVLNKGSSIDPDDMGSIFKPFFSKKRGGKGLGLFIAMRNIKLHGGDIKVECGPEGTKFTAQLPGKSVHRF